MSETEKTGRGKPRRPRGTAPLRRSVLHVDARGRARMVDVGAKGATRRVAVARGTVAMGAAAFEALDEGRLAKGDALAVARLAGIQAAKRTSEIVPLCHPLALESVEVDVELERGRREAIVTDRPDHGQDRRRDGGADRGSRGVPDPLRHDQGSRPLRRRPRDRPAREVGRPVGDVPAAGAKPPPLRP